MPGRLYEVVAAPVAVDLSAAGHERHARRPRAFGELEAIACHAPTLGNVQGIYSDYCYMHMGQSLSDGGGSTVSITRSPSDVPREWGARHPFGVSATPAPTCTTAEHRA